MIQYYYRDGRPIADGDDGQMIWSDLFANPAYQLVQQTTLPGGDKWVSTVWLGLDHGFGSHELPVIFESMVFNRRQMREDPLTGQWKPDMRDLDQRRYATEEDAIAGHHDLCWWWRHNRRWRRRKGQFQVQFREGFRGILPDSSG